MLPGTLGRKGRKTRDSGRNCGIVLGVSPEMQRICVSSSVGLAGLSDTITEESVSSDSAGETPQGLAG